MSLIQGANASCLCGAVEMSFTAVSENVGACHCNMCRKWSGSLFMGVEAGTEVAFNNLDEVSTFDSSECAERGFCFQCGSHLFYRIKQSGQYYIPVGLFDDQTKFVFDHQIFIDEKPGFYCFSNKTNNMTGEEFFAAFANDNS